METENEQVLEDVVVQEEESTLEEAELTLDESQEEDTVTLSKSELTHLKRKAMAYDAGKSRKEVRVEPKESSYQVTPETLERIELRQDGYTKEEVESIMDLGGTKALKNPLVKAAIDTMRAKEKSKDSNQPLNSKSPVFKKFTQADLSKMSSKELEAILPHD